MSINEDNDAKTALKKDLLELAGYINSIREQKFLLNETGITPRVFINWKNLGLIPSKEENRKWNKFSFTEFLWLKIIQELRTFGLSIEKILLIKNILFNKAFVSAAMDNLFENEKGIELAMQQMNQFIPKDSISGNITDFFTQVKETAANMYLLDMMIANSIIKKQNNALVIYSSGQCVPWFDEYYELNKENKDLGKSLLERPHIHIHLSKFIFDFLYDEMRESFISPLQILSKEEQEILLLLKNNDLKEIKIKFNDKSKPYILEIISGKQVSREEAHQIVKNMVFKNYQNITFKTNSNKTVYIEKTQKKNI